MRTALLATSIARAAAFPAPRGQPLPKDAPGGPLERCKGANIRWTTIKSARLERPVRSWNKTALLLRRRRRRQRAETRSGTRHSEDWRRHRHQRSGYRSSGGRPASRRTTRLMSFKYCENASTSCAASAAYWRVPYVPHPKHSTPEDWDALCTSSKYQLGTRRGTSSRCTGVARAPALQSQKVRPRDARWMARSSSTPISPFSYGDGTVNDKCRGCQLVEGKEFLLAGDLNSLTPTNAASLAKARPRSTSNRTLAAPL